MLVEEEHELGGHLRCGGAASSAALRELRAEVAAAPIDRGARRLGRHRPLRRQLGRRRPAQPARTSPSASIKARVKALVVVAAGLIERPYVFEGNDLPGVMLSTAVRRLVNLYAVKPGERAVVFTANDEGARRRRDLGAGRGRDGAAASTPAVASVVRATGASGAREPSSSATGRGSNATSS